MTVNPAGPYENIAEVTASDSTDPDATPGNGDPTEDDYASNTPAVNQAPVANDDAASTPTDTPGAVDVLANDAEAKGDDLKITETEAAVSDSGSTVGVSTMQQG